jgi:hypothetical protein
MSAEPIVADELYCVGTVCRSRNKVRMLAFPITAIRRANELQMVAAQ